MFTEDNTVIQSREVWKAVGEQSVMGRREEQTTWLAPWCKPSHLRVSQPEVRLPWSKQAWLTLSSGLSWNVIPSERPPLTRVAAPNSSNCLVWILSENVFSSQRSYSKSKDLTPSSFLYLLNLERCLALINLMDERQGGILLATPCLPANHFQITSTSSKSLLFHPQ